MTLGEDDITLGLIILELLSFPRDLELPRYRSELLEQRLQEWKIIDEGISA